VAKSKELSMAEWRGQVMEKLNSIERQGEKFEKIFEGIHEHCDLNDSRIQTLENEIKTQDSQAKLLKKEIKEEIQKEEKEEKQRSVNWITAALGIAFTAIQILLKFVPL